VSAPFLFLNVESNLRMTRRALHLLSQDDPQSYFVRIHQPLFLILLVLLFVGAGIMAFRSLPIEAFPM